MPGKVETRKASGGMRHLRQKTGVRNGSKRKEAKATGSHNGKKSSVFIKRQFLKTSAPPPPSQSRLQKSRQGGPTKKKMGKRDLHHGGQLDEDKAFRLKNYLKNLREKRLSGANDPGAGESANELTREKKGQATRSYEGEEKKEATSNSQGEETERSRSS